MEMTEGLIGRRQQTTDFLKSSDAARIAALVDRDPANIRDGDALPLGWHICLFTPLSRQSQLSPDGTPGEDPLLPALEAYPRRVMGGRRVEAKGRLSIGRPVLRISEVVSAEPKEGKGGKLLIVTVRHSLYQGDDPKPAIIDEYDAVYRGPALSASVSEAAPQQPSTRNNLAEATFRHSMVFDPTMLIRYSAVTYNAHRIHYDYAYATGAEQYPGLIVNGGLTAMMLLEQWRRHTGVEPSRFSVRNLNVLICGRQATLCGAPSASGWTLWAEDDKGQRAAEVTVN